MSAAEAGHWDGEADPAADCGVHGSAHSIVVAPRAARSDVPGSSPLSTWQVPSSRSQGGEFSLYAPLYVMNIMHTQIFAHPVFASAPSAARGTCGTQRGVLCVVMAYGFLGFWCCACLFVCLFVCCAWCCVCLRVCCCVCMCGAHHTGYTFSNQQSTMQSTW